MTPERMQKVREALQIAERALNGAEKGIRPTWWTCMIDISMLLRAALGLFDGTTEGDDAKH